METIQKIEELSFDGYDGFQLTTDNHIYKFGIASFQSCCEDWGYFITNDETENFVGSKLIDVNIVDECLNVSKAPDIYEGGVMYVNFETSDGTLQFTAYNEHNGYYGHDAVVMKDGNILQEECL